jgi:hypothetical protein
VHRDGGRVRFTITKVPGSAAPETSRRDDNVRCEDAPPAVCAADFSVREVLTVVLAAPTWHAEAIAAKTAINNRPSNQTLDGFIAILLAPWIRQDSGVCSRDVVPAER